MSFMKLGWKLGVVAVAAVASGCSDDEAADSASTASAVTPPLEGYAAIAPQPGAVYQSVAVVGGVAFVGDNARHVDLVRLDTMKKTGQIDARIPNDSLTAAGDRVIACGLRDDSPLDPFGHTPADRSYVLTVIDAGKREVAGEIELHIEPFLDSNPSEGFVDLPTLSCRFDAKTDRMTITFAQEELGREVISFPLPALGSTYEWTAIPGARRQTVDAGGEPTMTAAVASEGAVTYAAGGWGLRRQAAGQTRATTLRDEPREHIVDVAQRDEHLYLVDHDGALVVTDLDGKTVEKIGIDDYLHAVALTPSHVVVVGRSGLFATKDRWSR